MSLRGELVTKLRLIMKDYDYKWTFLVKFHYRRNQENVQECNTHPVMQIFGRYTGKTFIFTQLKAIKFHSCLFEQDLFHK